MIVAVAVVVAAMIAPAWVIVGVMYKGELDGRYFTTKKIKKVMKHTCGGNL